MTAQLIRNFTLALLAAATIYAQGSPKHVFQVPFGFHAGSTVLPSGEYLVDTNVTQGVVRLRSADTKSAAMILTHAVERAGKAAEGKLIFHKYGDEYFLSQVWTAGSYQGRQLPTSRREIEVASIARRGIEPVIAQK